MKGVKQVVNTQNKNKNKKERKTKMSNSAGTTTLAEYLIAGQDTFPQN